MKKIFDKINLPGGQYPGYSGLEPIYSREFIEGEENDENNFYSMAVEDFLVQGENKKKMCE